jgi:hypothetical protein
LTFADAVGAKTFLEVTHNIAGRELGVILPANAHWFITFEFNPRGLAGTVRVRPFSALPI